MECFSERLKEIRKKNHMTQEELAQILGVGKSTISNYETGYSKPDSVNLIKIADVFNVSLDYFFGRMLRDPVESSDYELETRLPVVKKISMDQKKLYKDQDILYYKAIGRVKDEKVEECFWLEIDEEYYLIHVQEAARPGDILLVSVESMEPIVARYEHKNGDSILLVEGDSNYIFKKTNKIKVLGKVL